MARSARTSRESIIDAARDICRQHGMGAVTISAVAGRCSVSEGTIYNYVTDKAELLRLLSGEGETPIQFLDRLRTDRIVDAESWLPEVAANALENFRLIVPLMLVRFATQGTDAGSAEAPREGIDALTRLIHDVEGGSEQRARARALSLVGICFNRVFTEFLFEEPVDDRDDATFIADLQQLFHASARCPAEEVSE